MMFLAELDHAKSSLAPTPDGGRTFIERIIFPTLERAEQLMAQKKILAGGAVAGRIALRFIFEADSAQEVERLIISMPLWALADTRVMPLIELADRRKHVQALLENLKPMSTQNSPGL